MLNRTPTLGQVIKYAVADGAIKLRVALPGRVISFDAEKQTAYIQPMIPEIQHNDDDTYTTYELPTLYEVPVCFPGTFQDGMTFPLPEDTEGWLVFSDRSIDKWMNLGAVADPEDLRRHDMSDAAFFPGVKSASNALTEFDTSRMVLGRQGGPRVAFSDDKIEIGQGHNGSSTEAVPLGNKLVSDLQAALNNINTFLTAVNAAAVGGAPVEVGFIKFAAALQAAYQASMTTVPQSVSNLSNDLSQKVKVS